METILFVAVIVALAGGAIWYYNRTNDPDVNKDGQVDIKDAQAALDNTAQGILKDTRDLRDAVLAQASESAARAQALIDSKTSKPRARKSPSTAGKATDKKASDKKASDKKSSDKKPAVRAKATKSRAPRSSK
jgi:hypothetical protein